MRWACKLQSPSLIVDRGGDNALPSAENHTLRLSADPQGRQAWVQAVLVDDVLQVTALDTLWAIYETREQAIEALAD